MAENYFLMKKTVQIGSFFAFVLSFEYLKLDCCFDW